VNIHSHSVQLEVTESQDHNAYRNVCIPQGAWPIADGRRLKHHVCHIFNLPQVSTSVISFKHLNVCGRQL